MATKTSPIPLDPELPYDDTLAEIERLVESGVHPDRLRMRHNECALHWVCSIHHAFHDGDDVAACGRRSDAHVALIALLLEHGADPNRVYSRGSTPVTVCCEHFAVYPEHRGLDKLRLVLGAGGDPRKTKDSALCTLLGLRGMRGEIWDMPFRSDAPAGHADTVLQAVDLLLQAGADIEAMDHRSMYTPVLLAAYLGSLPLLRLLKQRGAHMQATNAAGSNALMYAAGDVDGLAGSSAGLSATWHRFGDPVETLRQLLGWGLDPSVANARGRTPLRLAAKAGNFAAAVVLAENLAARGKLVPADVRLFRNTEYAAQVAGFATSTRPDLSS